MSEKTVVGRFAPTPSGRMHLGNVMCALVSWLSARSQGGRVLLRIEDLDTQRCGWEENTRLLIDDLNFLGLEFDDGYDRSMWQSARSGVYAEAFEELRSKGLVYPCLCTRSELHAATAPHLSDGRYVYDGRCYKKFTDGYKIPAGAHPSMRVHVPDENISFEDGMCGFYSENLARDCGDFVVRRADGIYAYQLAVTVDDCLSGVTEVFRGRDLLPSTPCQLWLAGTLGLEPPANYCHVPLMTDSGGRRLSKRDADLDMGALRRKYGPETIIGTLAASLGLIDKPEPIGVNELIALFSRDKLPRDDIRLCLPL